MNTRSLSLRNRIAISITTACERGMIPTMSDEQVERLTAQLMREYQDEMRTTDKCYGKLTVSHEMHMG